jgi:hypothetical protein
MDFANHYLFDASPCNVRSPHEKGRVERAVRYVRKNFLAGRTFKSITDCNAQSASWKDEAANCRIHGYILASHEMADRQERLVKTRITQARFPVVKTIDAFRLLLPKVCK